MRKTPTGRVLVVDDNPFIQRLAESVLLEAGHEVDLAEDGAAALSLLHARLTHYDVVVLDVQLPKVDGLEILRTLQTLRADLPVILSSGYPVDGRLRVAHLLRKPYLSSELLEAVERILRARLVAA